MGGDRTALDLGMMEGRVEGREGGKKEERKGRRRTKAEEKGFREVEGGGGTEEIVEKGWREGGVRRNSEWRNW